MKTCEPNDFVAAITACLENARTELLRNTGEVADAMAGPTRDAVYKWSQSGRMPIVEVPAFERACGAFFVSKQLAASSGHLIVKAPTEAGPGQLDFARLQFQVSKAMLACAAAHVAKSQEQEAARSITHAIEALVAMRTQLERGLK